MKTKLLLLTSVMLMFTALAAVAQDATEKKYSEQNIPFGKKLPTPDLNDYADNSLMQNFNLAANGTFRHNANVLSDNKIHKTPEYFRQLFLERKKMQATLCAQNKLPVMNIKNVNSSDINFHLTKDIDSLAESNPRNFTNHSIDIYDNPHNDSVSYAVLDEVIYFVADDGIHGSELWRSDGTEAGTYLLKELEPGTASSLLFNLTAVNGKIYFTGYSSVYGYGAWVCDGTESGTQLLASVGEPTEFFAWGSKVYFIADGFDFWSTVWETDGTIANTKQVIELGDKGSGGQQIIEPTIVNGLLFFIFLSYEGNIGWQLWRSVLSCFRFNI